MSKAFASSKVKCRAFTEREFLTSLGILIGAAEFAAVGSDLFHAKDQLEGVDDNDVWQSFCAEPYFKRLCHLAGRKIYKDSFLILFQTTIRRKQIHGFSSH